MVSSTRRVDCERVFYLVLGMQEHFQELRSRKDIAPYRQTQSEKVMTVQSLIVCDIFLLTEIQKLSYPFSQNLVMSSKFEVRQSLISRLQVISSMNVKTNGR